MDQQTRVIEYKCPCCTAGLRFDDATQKLKCEYCGNEFDLETVRAYNESEQQESAENVHWEEEAHQSWSEEEQAFMQMFTCPSCGGEVIADDNTTATFCPYCGNPTIMPARLSGGLKPDAVLPFQKGKDDAKEAFLKFCKGKPLLPRMFTREQQIKKITGMYVPYWLYDCKGDINGSYRAQRIQTWSDANYNYTKTEHYLLKRQADGEFVGIPMDGSSKMDDTFMESIEPFDYQDLKPFDTAYLTGYLADRYDVEMEAGQERIQQRVSQAMDEELNKTFVGYSSVVPSSRQLNVNHSKARYVLLPVWMLNTKYKDKIYTFMMNGQTGKISGSLPVSAGRAAGMFAGIFAGVAVVLSLILALFGM